MLTPIVTISLDFSLKIPPGKVINRRERACYSVKPLLVCLLCFWIYIDLLSYIIYILSIEVSARDNLETVIPNVVTTVRSWRGIDMPVLIKFSKLGGNSMGDVRLISRQAPLPWENIRPDLFWASPKFYYGKRY